MEEPEKQLNHAYVVLSLAVVGLRLGVLGHPVPDPPIRGDLGIDDSSHDPIKFGFRLMSAVLIGIQVRIASYVSMVAQAVLIGVQVSGMKEAGRQRD
jgi:hypothetical protein